MPFKLSSKSFETSAEIPTRYTCDGADDSPALSWNEAPDGTSTFALICDDPDAPVGLFTHWVLYGLSSDVSELPENLPKDAEVQKPACKQGVNDFRRIGYGGPCPPRGSRHRYFFKLFALDNDPKLPAGSSRKEVERAINGHVLGEAKLMGTYQRR